MLRSWREVRAARRKGRRDGRAGVPAPRDEAIPFELREILARADGQVEELHQRWRREDAALAAELAEAERNVEEAAERLSRAEARRDAELEEHERRSAEEEERLSHLQAQLAELPTLGGPDVRLGLAEASDGRPGGEVLDVEPSSEPEDVAAQPEPGVAADAEVQRPHAASTLARVPDGEAGLAAVVPHPARAPAASGTHEQVWAVASRSEDAGWHGIPAALYWFVIVAILLGEFPLNAVAFRVFGESDLFTYVMTASLAVALVAIAHFLGAVAAGRIDSRGVRVAVGGFAAVLVLGIGVIAMIRYDYLERAEVGAVGPVAGMLSFAAINLLVFAAASGFSYLHHDPRTLVNRRAAARRAEREAERAERRRAERERRAEEEARRREEERRRFELELERERRQRLLEAERERHRQLIEAERDRRRLELDAHRDAVMLRRQQLLDAIEDVRAAARERLGELEELERAVEAARVALAGFEAQVRSLQRARESLRDQARARFGLIRAHRDRLVAAYCAANVRARKDRASPRCFERIPPLVLPPELEERAPAGRRSP